MSVSCGRRACGDENIRLSGSRVASQHHEVTFVAHVGVEARRGGRSGDVSLSPQSLKFHFVALGVVGDELKLRFGDKAKSKGVNKGFNSWFGKHPIDKKFSVFDSCIGCGKCERVCPTGNIVIEEDKKPTWHGNCIQCLSCISRCPENAIVYGKKQKEKYFCPKI